MQKISAFCHFLYSKCIKIALINDIVAYKDSAPRFSRVVGRMINVFIIYFEREKLLLRQECDVETVAVG